MICMIFQLHPPQSQVIQSLQSLEILYHLLSKKKTIFIYFLSLDHTTTSTCLYVSFNVSFNDDTTSTRIFGVSDEKTHDESD